MMEYWEKPGSETEGCKWRLILRSGQGNSGRLPFENILTPSLALG